MYVFAFSFVLMLFLILLSADVSGKKLEQYYTILIIKGIIKIKLLLELVLLVTCSFSSSKT